jgi:gamma-glutamylcyclotransferase (GGCT)/AIG2-like uncharacterized protein YtfP
VHLFTYGTLVFPEVMEAVTGRRFESRTAVLRGYRRRMLQGRVYPGIRPAAADATEGRVYLEIDAAALACLDDFEGDEYERRRVEVGVQGGTLVAEAYVVRGSASGLLTEVLWDPGRFTASQLRPYVERCRRFRSERTRSSLARSPAAS